MLWNDEITLITLTPPAEAVDEHGFHNPHTETRKTVYANKKSVGYSEFYKAKQAGYSTELKFDIHTEEYEGQTMTEYDGKRYKVLRTFVSKNGETTELTLSDLTERGGADGGEV